MELEDFVSQGEDRWVELEDLISASRRRAERLGVEGVNRLADLYRETSSDLAVARRRFPSDPVVDRLTRLVVAARSRIHDRRSRREALRDFFAVTYFELIVERSRLMWVALGCLVVPAGLGMWWVSRDPLAVRSILPPEFLWVTEAPDTDVGYSASQLVGFSTFVMTNNIRVALLVFVAGIGWGVLSAYLLAQNGLLLGALTALAAEAGNGRVLIEAIAAHGVLELSCIVVAGGAGLSLGRSMLRPGPRTRLASMAEEANKSVLIAVGTAPWLVLAGLVEGFVSRTGTGWAPGLLIGLGLGGAYWWPVWRTARRLSAVDDG